MEKDKLAQSLADMQVSDPKKYQELMSKLIESEKNGNEDARYVIGKVGEISARDRKGYEGLQEFAMTATGGAPAIFGTYLPRALGSAWNGYSMFDPNSPGVVTKNFQERNPYWSLAANVAAGIASGVGLEAMTRNRGGFNNTEYIKSKKSNSALKSEKIGNAQIAVNKNENINMPEIIKRSIQEARDFADDPIVTSSLKRDVRVAKNFGYDIDPQIGRRSGQLNVKITNESGNPHWMPSQQYEAGQINLPWKTIANWSADELGNTVFHEGIHSQGIGVDRAMMSETSPLAMFQETPTTRWYQFKANRLLATENELKSMYNFTEEELNAIRQQLEYLSRIGGNGNEFTTNAIEVGKRMGLNGYKAPTSQEINRAVNQFVNSNSMKNGFFKLLKHRINPQTGEIELTYPGYTWKLLTGQYNKGGKINL